MDLVKKIIVGYYMVIVGLTLVVVYLDGSGGVTLKSGTIQNIITVFSIAIVPVALSAVRTANFWRDDPNSVANLQRRHAEEVAMLQKENIAAMATKDKTHAEEMAGAKKEIKGLLRDAAISRNPLATVPGSEISIEEAQRRNPDNEK